MTLLDQEVKKQEPKGKKIVLFLLILSVFALIMIIVMMMALSGKQQTKELSISINGTDIEMQEGLLITDDNGVNYISIQKIAKTIGYNYLTGEYKQYNEDNTNTKCYLESANQVIQFEAGINKIYKINPTSDLDYEEYQLKNIVLKQNNLLYISLDDLEIALNVVESYSESDNKISLKTVETLYSEYKKSLPVETNNAVVGLSDNFNNKKAIAHGMLVISNEAGKWGVISSEDFSTIIGNKYSSIEFVESAGTFIVSDNNKYGVITDKEVIINLNYEEINLINNNPVCYKIRSGQKYVIVNEKGNPLSNKAYTSVGYNSQSSTEESVLAIKNFGENNINLLVVCENQKYGLVNLDNGTSVGECVLDKVYSKTENGEKNYYIQLQEQEILLAEYLEYINTTTVNVAQ